MNFEHMKYVTAVAKYGNVSEAARRLYVSQPYLSSMISRLEKELGFPLFTRGRTGLKATACGELFLHSAAVILKELDRIGQIAEEVQQRPLIISGIHSMFLMRCFLRFRETGMGTLHDRYIETGNEETIQEVGEQNGVIGLIMYAPEKKERYMELTWQAGCLAWDLLAPEKMFVMLSERHELGRKNVITYEEFLRCRYVCYDDSSTLRYLKVIGIAHKQDTLKVSNRGGLMDAILSGGYVTLTTEKEARGIPDVSLLPIRGHDLSLCSSLIAKEGHCFTEREDGFIRFLREAAES